MLKGEFLKNYKTTLFKRINCSVYNPLQLLCIFKYDDFN